MRYAIMQADALGNYAVINLHNGVTPVETPLAIVEPVSGQYTYNGKTVTVVIDGDYTTVDGKAYPTHKIARVIGIGQMVKEV
jgi:hypothetical protein